VNDTRHTARKATPHQRIVKAALAGVGMRLSADEVAYLAMDDAIQTRAVNDDYAERNKSDEHDLTKEKSL
jgi:hypothetical protein